MFRTYVLGIMITAISLTAGAAKPTDLVAEIGDVKITVKDFDKKYKEVQKTLNPPTREELLTDIVRYTVGVQEAKRRKLESDPIVQERLEQIMYTHLLESELGKKADELSVSDSEMKEFYKSNPELHMSHILIALKPNASAKEKAIAKKRAQEILSEVQKSKRPFEELVKLYSDDSISKVNGGDLGWQTELTFPNKEFFAAVKKLKVGQLSPLIETPFGYHIVKLTGINTFTDADKTKIRAAVLEVKKKQLFDSFFSKLMPKYKIKTYKENLN